MKAEPNPTLDKLCRVDNPRGSHDWNAPQGQYAHACQLSEDDIDDLIAIASRWSDPEWFSSPPTLSSPPAWDPALLPVAAWRALADLRAAAAVEPLIKLLRDVGDEFDEYTSEEVPQVMALIGPPALEPLLREVRDDGLDDLPRGVAARALSELATRHASTRDRVADRLSVLMAHSELHSVDFNTSLLCALVDVHAVDAAEAIERAFAADRLDVGVMGDWEDVRKMLGVEGLGLEMPDEPYNSMAFLKDVGRDFERVQQRVAAEDLVPAYSLPAPLASRKIGRNDPCPCGSGKKHKKCCLHTASSIDHELF